MRFEVLALVGISALAVAMPRQPQQQKRQIIPGGISSTFTSGSDTSGSPSIPGPGAGSGLPDDFDLDEFLKNLPPGWTVSRRQNPSIPSYEDAKRDLGNLKRGDDTITIGDSIAHVIAELVKNYLKDGILQSTKPSVAIEITIGVARNELTKMGVPKENLDAVDAIILDAFTEFGIATKTKAKRQSSIILGQCNFSDVLTLRTTLAFLETVYGPARSAPSNVANLMRAIDTALEFCANADGATTTISPDPTVSGGPIIPDNTVPGGAIVPDKTVPGGSIEVSD